MTEKVERLLKEMNLRLKGILIAMTLKETDNDQKIKILCCAGLKSEEIGNIIGITGRGVRKNKFYKE